MRIITSDMMLDLPYERAVIHAEPYEPGQDEETEMVKVFARVDGTDFCLGTYPEKRWPEIHESIRHAAMYQKRFFRMPEN